MSTGYSFIRDDVPLKNLGDETSSSLRSAEVWMVPDDVPWVGSRSF